MAHSVEFILDEVTDQRVRAQWTALADAGLPSQADIRSATNRPHITALAAERIEAAIDEPLAAVGEHMPFEVALGAVIVFGRGSLRVVARLVVPTSELLSVHARILRLGSGFAFDVAGDRGVYEHCSPGSWTPHVTLARRVPLENLSAVLDIVEHSTAVPRTTRATITGVRRWDPEMRTAGIVAGRDH
ncbi:2'-5' RNA ligase family protein [Gordonia sp. i37]|uniref:2'-5' RNA ligase family protein n=1 Tax=Gordonia sp. i37 TaxID=1961707 RepID=UPI0009AC3FEB|nr:2'-5' RNA ligase family protein [Gordonia sp. i37]OPX14887.1 hypothetical protein B1964_12695 [Gordonia sp. i37]